MTADSSTRRSCPSEYLLDRYTQGELTDDSRAIFVAKHLQGCEGCAAFVRQARVPAPAWEVVKPLRPAGARRATALSLLAVAAVVGLLFVPTPTPVRDALPFSSVQNVRRKASGLHLDVLVKGGTKPVERLLEGDELAAGDRLRFEVSSPAPGFVGVIGIDGTGTVSALAPPKGWLYALTTSDKILLPDAVVLDNAAGAESLLLFLCEERQEIETLTVALRRNLDVAPFGCRTTRVNFNKRVGL